MKRPRALNYYILRCRERLHLSEAEFQTAPYQQQLNYLAYELIRQQEKSLIATNTP